MDPPHITEFASERYFSKLKQLGEPSTAQDGPTPADHVAVAPVPVPAPALVPAPFSVQSPFILPLRESKAAESNVDLLRSLEPKKPEKSRLFSSLRSKGSFFHSTKTPPTTQPQEQPRVSVSEIVRKRCVMTWPCTICPVNSSSVIDTMCRPR